MTELQEWVLIAIPLLVAAVGWVSLVLYGEPELKKAWEKRRCVPKVGLVWLMEHLMPKVIVSREVEGVHLYYHLRDNAKEWIFLRGRLDVIEPEVHAMLKMFDGPVWDVGSNLGDFTVAAAKRDMEVVAFEMSPHAMALLSATLTRNDIIDVRLVCDALTCQSTPYHVPETGIGGNKLTCANEMLSLGISDALITYDIPGLIKMDIEGGEVEFFEHMGFKSLVENNNLAWVVETHPQYGCTEEVVALWDDVPHMVLRHRADSKHIVYHRDEQMIACAGHHREDATAGRTWIHKLMRS